jgi:hypothetical protein
MENTIDKTTKLQNDYDFMYDAYVVKQMKPREIAALLNISIKLVDLKIREHGLFV